MSKAYKETLCYECDNWIDEGEDIFFDKDGNVICEDCKL